VGEAPLLVKQQPHDTWFTTCCRDRHQYLDSAAAESARQQHLSDQRAFRQSSMLVACGFPTARVFGGEGQEHSGEGGSE
jgi:hypothetical protein